MEIGNGRGCNGNLQWMTLPSHRRKQRVTTVSVLATNNVRIRYGHGLTAESVSGTKRTPCTYVMGHFLRTYNTASVETPVQARLVPWRSPFCNNTDRPTLHPDTVSLYCGGPRFLTCLQSQYFEWGYAGYVFMLSLCLY